MSGAADSKRQPLPHWAEVLRQKYLAGEASTFVLYRNVFDSYEFAGQLVDLQSFLVQAVLKDTKRTICEVSLDKGVRRLRGDANVSASIDNDAATGVADSAQIVKSLQVLDAHMRSAQSTALIVPYADSLLPAGDPSFLAHADRQIYLTFHRWSLDKALTQGDNIILLVTESLGAINAGLLSNPKVAAIEIPMPDRDTRRTVIGLLAPKLTPAQGDLFADRTAGLRSVQLSGLLSGSGSQGLTEEERKALILKLLSGTADAEQRAQTLATITAGMTPEEITRLIEPGAAIPDADPNAQILQVIHARKREMIEKECAGLIEFIEPKMGLDAVGGHENIKAELLSIAAKLKAGDRTLTPMGLLAVGPMGSGKTFVIKAFLKEAGLSGVALKNFRSKWVGSTETNLERVLATVKAMGPIAVVIDEGDRSFGSGGEDSDGGTSSRIIARLKEFMAETENRGQVLFVMMTNRPDKLDTDIKRPGRLDRKIPFFYCQSAEERAAVLKAVLRRYDESLAAPDAEVLAVCADLDGYSNADLEAIALLAVEYARGEGKEIGIDALRAATADFIPPQERDMIEFMELLAVSETSRRSLLPDQYRTLTIQEIQDRLMLARNRALSH